MTENTVENTTSKQPYTITTIDNPYNPFTEFTDWYSFDCLHNYGTTEKLSRVCSISDAFTDEENAEEIESGVDALLAVDFLGLYKKAYETDNFRDTAVASPYEIIDED